MILLFLVSVSLTAQVPQGFTYQAVARNSSGNPIASTSFQVRIGITSDAAGNTYVWEEEQSVTTNEMGVFTLVVGNPAATRIQGVATFSAINWSATPLYIKTSINYPSSWQVMGTTQLWSVPYSMLSSRSVDFAGTFDFQGDTIVILKNVSIGGDDAGKALLAVTSLDDTSGDPLFEVKRKDGQTVFAVYNDAVNIYVPKTTGKASKGGFAIGSFDEAKAGVSQDFFSVTPDSVRIYINDNPSFAKGSASKGGFAIGSFDENKGLSKTYLNITAAAAVDTVTSSAQILWYPRKEAFLAGRVHVGSADSVGQNSTALGYHTIAMGNWSQALGYRAKALRPYSTAVGNNAIASGDDSYALGSGAEASGIRSFALGSVGVDESGNATTRKTVASGPFTVAIGMGAQATTQSAAMAFGTNSTASGFASTSIGYNSTASNHYAVAIGYRSTASQYYAHAFGLSAEATAQGSLALGMYSKATGNYSSAMGYWSQATKQYSVAIGYYAMAQGDYSGAFGRSAQANGNNSVAVGYGVVAGGENAGAFGRSASASGLAALSLGFSTSASGQYSVGVGYQSTASNTYATAIGYQAKATAANSFSFGNNAEAAGDNSFAIGTYGLNGDGTVNTARPTKTFLSYSIALGMGAQSTKKGALSFGVNPTASGDYSTAIGYGPTASANYSTAIGVNATSSGTYSMAGGYGSTSEGGYSLALGMNSHTTGNYASALGYGARAYGDKSISIGSYYSTVLRKKVLIGGVWMWLNLPISVYNTATDDYSIAFGNGNTSSQGGMAIGSNNVARAVGSVAIGHSNVADSSFSFAAGYSSTASGNNAFVLGENATAQSLNSFVIGTYNIISGDKDDWVASDPLFVVGNGSSSSDRSNAITITKGGRIGIQSVTSPLYAVDLPNVNSAGTGWIRAYGLVSYSDSRVKSGNIPLEYGLNEILMLNPQSYFHHNSTQADNGFIINTEGGKDIGLIAQDVYRIIPEVVIKPDDESRELWSMSYEKLVPVLIKGMQEQQTIIESQQKEIDELKALYESLKTTLNQIVNK
ncbi:MAG: tail fiber domain-containing protein [Bacteroidales bacterium]|nr:tail fiber domain-containing protein [Bacteroidales bacterium]